MQSVHKLIPLRLRKLGQFGREYRLKFRPSPVGLSLPVVPQLIGERFVDAGRPPRRSHLLKDAGPLADERLDPRGQRLIWVDPVHQRPEDLLVPVDRLDQQRFHVGELLPDGAQRHARSLSDPRSSRAQVTFGMQDPHGVYDGAPGPVRPGGATVRRLHLVGGPVFLVAAFRQTAKQRDNRRTGAPGSTDRQRVSLNNVALCGTGVSGTGVSGTRVSGTRLGGPRLARRDLLARHAHIGSWPALDVHQVIVTPLAEWPFD